LGDLADVEVLPEERRGKERRREGEKERRSE